MAGNANWHWWWFSVMRMKYYGPRTPWFLVGNMVLDVWYWHIAAWGKCYAVSYQLIIWAIVNL
jgi:hypothetical protein